MDGAGFPTILAPARRARRIAWRSGGEHGTAAAGERAIAEEVAVAFAYQGTSYAVMMATPADLEDFAVGFSLTEGIVAHAGEIEALDIIPAEAGIVLRIALRTGRAELFWERRHRLAGPSGCGLCGLESLAAALRPCRPIQSAIRIACGSVADAMAALAERQRLNHETRAVHGAAFWHQARGVTAVREDVGRHNALDKLAGALARRGESAGAGAILLTSRVSVEMVQKAAAVGAPVLIAVSAPTALAVRVADAAGITLAAIARADGFEIFTHPERFADAG